MIVAGIDFTAIRDAVSVETLMLSEGQKIRGGRCLCPFCDHPTRFNFKVNNSDGTAFCFSCHRHADVVDVAAQMWRMGKLDAARELNDRFRLKLSDTLPTAERRKQLSEREQKRQAARDAVTAAEAEARSAWAEVERIPEGMPGHAEAIHRARNADIWLRFKQFECKDIEAGRG